MEKEFLNKESNEVEKKQDDLDNGMNEDSDKNSIDESSKLLNNYFFTISALNNFSGKNIDFLFNQMKDRSIFTDNMMMNQVKSYKKWKDLGVQVQKGETALKVYAPVLQYKIKKDEVGNNIKKGKFWEYEKDKNGNKIKDGIKFVKVSVFNSSQTDAEELGVVKKINLKTDNENISKELLNNFIQEVSEKFNIEIKQKQIPATTQGFYVPSLNQIVLNNEYSNETQLKTLFHELGHKILHSDEDSRTIKTKTKEAEAESVSFILSSKLGIESGSERYIKSYGNNAEDVKARLTRIQNTSKDIFKEIDFDSLISKEQNRIEKVSNLEKPISKEETIDRSEQNSLNDKFKKLDDITTKIKQRVNQIGVEPETIKEQQKSNKRRMK